MRFKFFILVLIFLKSDFLSANSVTGFNAFYKYGQVFCTWANLNATGVQYKLYKSSTPILHGSDLINCQYLGAVRDSSSLNKELSEIQGQSNFLKIDSLGAPLNSTTGLFVTTSQQAGNFYYALTTFSNGVEDTAVTPGENSLVSAISEVIDRPQPVYQFTTIVSNKPIEVYVLYTSLTSTSVFPQMINVGSFPFNMGVFRNGTGSSHPLTIRLSGGGSNFLSGIVANVQPNEYRISLDDWLPNGSHSLWFGYNEQYDIFSHLNAPPTSGVNYDYALERLQYAIDWGIHNLPIDSNSIYFSGVSGGAAGAFFSSLVYPSRIAAASLNVPKFDLSFLNDPDTTNNYNTGMPGRLRVDTLIGTVPTNLLTNFGVHTYDLVNGGWLAHEHANDNVPLLFAVNGKHDTMVGWAEKIPYYDSVNTNRLGGFYFWDNRKHSGEGQQWIFSPNLMRYHRNVSFPAFSNCSFDNNPGDGHADSGDTLGTINGFLDWSDLIEDNDSVYEIALFMHNLLTFSGSVVAPDSCFTDITLRRLQHFSVPPGAFVVLQNEHHTQVVQQDTFLYSGGLITLHAVKIFRDTSVIHVSFTVPTGIHELTESQHLSVTVFPNPNDGFFSVHISDMPFKTIHVELTDLSGKTIQEQNLSPHTSDVIFSQQNRMASGLYLLRVSADKQFSIPVLIVVK